MASKFSIPEVGSVQWISNEIADARNKETEHFEDFTIAIRNELEWLNEHMSEVFQQGSKIDITELYKTPGKLRGKTPRHPRKINLIEEENNDEFFAPRANAVQVLPAPENPASNPLPTHVDEDTQSPVSTPDLVRDCGEWSGSSGAPSLAGSFAIIAAEAVERSSPAKKPSYDVAPHVVAEIAEQRNFSDVTRKSFLSAQEEPLDEPSDDASKPISPIKKIVSEHSEAEEEECGRDENEVPSGDGDFRREEDEAIPDVITTIEPSLPNFAPSPSRTPAAPIRDYSVSPVQISSPMAPSSPISPIQQKQQQHQQQEELILTPNNAVPVDQAAESDTPSDAASPTAGVTRSSMNFASLPARETLTHKKSMGGNNVPSRNSHIDDRTSFFGRLTGGKSLGAASNNGDLVLMDTAAISGSNASQSASHNASDDETDEDDDLNEQLRLAEINKAATGKTSTQRLTEKISKLGQQGTTRLSKSISASSLTAPNQSDEPTSLKTPGSTMKPLGMDLSNKARESTQSDEGDWIPSRPEVSRTQTAPVPTRVPASPVRLVGQSPQKTIPSKFTNKVGTFTPAKAFNAGTQSSTKLPVPTSTIKSAFPASSVKYPTLPSENQAYDAVTPSKAKLSQDVDVSTAKKNQANIFSFAKQLLWRSGRSESPKPAQEPPRQSPQKRGPENIYPDIAEAESSRIVEAANHPLYPEVQAPLAHPSSHPSPSPSPTKLKPSEPTRGKLLTYGDAVKREVQLKGPSPAVIEGIDLVTENVEDLLHSPQVSDGDPVMPGSPFSGLGTSDEEDDGDDEEEDIGRHMGASKPVNRSPRKVSRKSSPQTHTPTRQPNAKNPLNRGTLQSKASDLKKPIRGLFGVKEGGVGKPKPTSSNIRLVTASQREMDQRKGPSIPVPNTTALANALADSFGPSKDPAPRPASAMSTASNSSLRAPKSIAALNSAAKAQKREQEERERKAAQKQEIERRRQENMRREEARREEERKQLNTKKSQRPLEKMSDDDTKKKPVGTTKNPQPTSVKPLSKTTPFSHKAPLVDRNLSSKPSQEIKRQPKRMFPGEEENKLRKEEHHSAKAPGPPEQKRRKTEDVVEVPAPSAFAPPIRQSTAKKENLPPPSKIGGIFSQDYTPATHHSQFAPGSSLMKSSVQSQAAKLGMAIPHVDAVKYSHDKLKFGTMMTPAPQKTARAPTTAPRESPIYPNPESIELPEIHTDSEDEGDGKSFRVPNWADSPELRQALQDQLGIDPETIFGPIAPLSMEDIFRGRADRAKFRARTSSANWSGADRLTAAEIEADRIERQRILDNGGWTYQKP